MTETPVAPTPKRANRRSTTGAPRWAKVFGIVAIILILAVAAVHLSGRSLFEHVVH